MKIVRKKHRDGTPLQFWIGSTGAVICGSLYSSFGFPARDEDAKTCGTTLAALRAELMDSPAPLEGTNDE